MTLTKEEVLNRLLEGKPISVVRAGDGEGIILNAHESISALRTASEAVLRRQIGYDPTVKEVDEIRQNLIDTYTTAEIIGIPMHKQKTNGHWTKVVEILNTNVPIRATPADNCDIDVAYQWREDGSYDKLLQDRRVLNYISCRDLDEGFKRKWDIKIVNQYLIAPEAKFTSGYDGDRHYPTQFNRIPRWIEVQLQNYPGSLLLVGAGVIGKIYCNWWRDRGGVAMDVGGVMDSWGGWVTRGPERGLDKEDLTYKL